MKDTTKKLYNEINGFSTLCRHNHLDTYSAAAAFFFFVSIIPFCILVLSIIPYTPISEEDIYNILRTIFPPAVDSLITDIVDQVSTESITLVSVSAIVLLWTAARGILSIKNGLNEIHNKTENRNFIMLRLNAAFYMILFILSIFGMLFLHVIVTGIDRYFRAILHIDISESSMFFFILLTFRPVITIVVGFLANIYFFTMLPNDKCKIRDQIPGALFVSVCWYLFSALFSLYVSNFNAYSMYGSLSIIIIALFWLYACFYILFIGAQFNIYLISKR